MEMENLIHIFSTNNTPFKRQLRERLSSGMLWIGLFQILRQKRNWDLSLLWVKILNDPPFFYVFFSFFFFWSLQQLVWFFGRGLQFIDYSDLLSITTLQSHDQMPSLYPFVEMFLRWYKGDANILDNEWKHLDRVLLPSEVVFSASEVPCDAVTFYQNLVNCKDENYYLIIKNISTLALHILAFLVPNNDAERLFSKSNKNRYSELNSQFVKASTVLLQIYIFFWNVELF